jgi:hypothetical protein
VTTSVCAPETGGGLPPPPDEGGVAEAGAPPPPQATNSAARTAMAALARRTYMVNRFAWWMRERQLVGECLHKQDRRNCRSAAFGIAEEGARNAPIAHLHALGAQPAHLLAKLCR